MTAILKYPRTPHITGSRLQPGDEDVKQVASSSLAGIELVVEEKLDGANSAISFDPSGQLVLQSRGHVLAGGAREEQFDLFKRWAHHHASTLSEILGRRYVMYGEWLYARHTIAYDLLPHYFIEFDILDREAGIFLSTERRRSLLRGSPVVSVPVLGRTIGADDLERYLGISQCATSEWMEGLYLKREQDGSVIGRYKFVRSGFLQAVADSGEHWMGRPIEPNRLRTGAGLFL